MNARLGFLVGLAAALTLASVASATTYSFDLSGTGSAGFQTLVSTAPSAPCRNGEAATVLVCAFSAGSSLQLDVRDGVATIEGATLLLETVTSIFPSTIIASSRTLSLSGGYGVLSGDTILWSGAAEFSESGTASCAGSACGFIGLTSGVVYPLGVLDYLIVGASPVNPIRLGTWQLSSDLASILGSTRATTSVQTNYYYSLLGVGTPMSWLVFGPQDLGSIPEPARGVLVALGLVGLGLRLRRRDSELLGAAQPAAHPE